jgi:hypothetical protein
MAKDVFNREVNLGTPLAAESTRLLVAGLTDEDMLAQNVRIEYKQNINRLWEVGSSKQFFIAGRTEGTMSVGRVVGGKGVSGEFIKQYGDVCNIASNHITLKLDAGCGSTSDKGSITASGVVVNSVAYNVQAQDMIINEEVSMMFARLNYGGGTSAGVSV